jgi:hypothetical protein
MDWVFVEDCSLLPVGDGSGRRLRLSTFAKQMCANCACALPTTPVPFLRSSLIFRITIPRVIVVSTYEKLCSSLASGCRSGNAVGRQASDRTRAAIGLMGFRRSSPQPQDFAEHTPPSAHFAAFSPTSPLIAPRFTRPPSAAIQQPSGSVCPPPIPCHLRLSDTRHSLFHWTRSGNSALRSLSASRRPPPTVHLHSPSARSPFAQCSSAGSEPNSPPFRH